jgi:hypothetical protein
MANPFQFMSEESGTWGSFEQALVNPPVIRLQEIHGFNPNPDAYYIGLIINADAPPIAGSPIHQPILVPGGSEFSWVPFTTGWPLDFSPGANPILWVVSSTYDVFTDPLVDFWVSGTITIYSP